MPPTIVQSAVVAGGNYPLSYTLPSPTTAGNWLIAVFHHSYAGCAPSVSDGRNGAWVFKGSQLRHAGEAMFFEVFTKQVTTAGTTAITLSAACGSARLIGLLEVSGLDATEPYQGENRLNNTTSPVASGPVTVASGDLLLGVLTNGGGGPSFVGTNGTAAVAASPAASDWCLYKLAGATGTDELTGTETGVDLASYPVVLSVASFKAAVGGGSPQTAAPLAAVCTAVALAATITLGAVTLAPTAAAAASVARAPTITLGAVARSPVAAVAFSVARAPTITLGAVTTHPASAIATAVALSGTITRGASPQTARPLAAASSTVARDPVVTLGAVARTLLAAASTTVARTPTITLGAVAARPSAAMVTSVARGPAITLSAVTAYPSAAVVTSVALAPTITVQPLGAHAAALTGRVTTRTRLAGTVALSPQLTGVVTTHARLTGTITIRPAS